MCKRGRYNSTDLSSVMHWNRRNVENRKQQMKRIECGLIDFKKLHSNSPFIFPGEYLAMPLHVWGTKYRCTLGGKNHLLCPLRGQHCKTLLRRLLPSKHPHADSLAKQQDFPTAHCTCDYQEWFGSNSSCNSFCFHWAIQVDGDKVFSTDISTESVLCDYLPQRLSLSCLLPRPSFSSFLKGWELKFWISTLRLFV